MYSLKDLVGDWDDPDVFTGSNNLEKLPIKSPEPLQWKTQENPTRLSRMFKFSEEEKMNAFLIDILEHQSETGHHGRLTVQYPKIKIEVWTHTLNDITEVDFEWANTVNDIYEGYNE